MNDKKSKLSLSDLERHLWEAAHIITGPIDASDYKTYIFPILFFKRVCDVYDEEFEEAMEFYGDEEIAKAPEQHRIEVPEGCHWNDVIAATKDVGKALKAAFLGIGKTNDRLYGIFGDAPWTNKERLPDHLLFQLLNHFNKIKLGVGHYRDVIFANPPYSIKKWDRSKFGADPFKRNEFCVPPQGCADYAFFQHIIKILNPKTGRAAMLWPHGVLFRNSEQDIRKKVIEDDMIEAVIGLRPNLFYNSPMESCA